VNVVATSTVQARPCIVDSINVFGCKCVVRDGTSTNAALMTLRGTTAQSAAVDFPRGARFTRGLHVTLTGSSASVTIAFR
jgi:hypothetical protein